MGPDGFHGEQYRFLLNELRVGLTFTRIGLQTRNPERRKRCGELARLAYGAVVKFSARASLSDEEARDFGSGFDRLQEELHQVEQTVEAGPSAPTR